MAHTNREEPDLMSGDLAKNPKKYSFFQVIRLLKRIAGKKMSFSEFLRNHVRIRPELSLGFPGTDVCDIRDISTEGFPRFEITASFLGLYGPASPLPTYYTEDVIAEALDEENVKKDFLDIFNDPVFKLFYETWSKYRLSVKIIDESDAEGLERLYSLVGLSDPRMRRRLPESQALLRYAGLFLSSCRSAQGLQTLIADFFGLPGVEIEQCAAQQVPIDRDQQCLLGRQACEVGGDSHIGSQIMDRSSKIHIRCGPVDKARFHDICPGTDRYEQLVRVINAYLDQPLSVDIRFVVYRDEIGTTTLGGPSWCRLGFHTWLITCAGDPLPIESNASYTVETGTVQTGLA